MAPEPGIPPGVVLFGSMKAGLALASTLLAATGMSSAPAPPTLLLTGAAILDPSGDRWIEGREILLQEGRIRSIGAPGVVTVPQGARTVDLTGLKVVPGLVDLHTHLLLRPYDEARWDDQVLRESLEARTIRAVAAAKATLEAGFTTIRDLGTEGAGFADVALRDAAASGTIPGPRILAATQAIVATATYGPSGFDPRWDVPKGAQEATGPDEVRRAVRQQIAAGADWVKVYADYRRAPGSPDTPTFSQAELDALVAEAASAGRPVAAHAVTPEGIRRAIAAGVVTIEHGYLADDAVLARMREKGVVLCPTLAAYEASALQGGWKRGEPEPARLAQSREAFRRALRAGVTIACGSDAGVFRHGDNAREIELMAANGMKPAEALRAATSVAAGVLGRGEDLGRVAEGYVADLVVVRGDPLADPAALRDPVMVVQGGRVVVDRHEPRRASHDATVHHRFEDAAAWSRVFDDPERDAWQKPESVIDALGVRAGSRVADLGAGTGYFTVPLAKRVTATGTVYAVDIEPSLVAWIRERAAKASLSQVVPVLASADDPALPAGRVDLVLVVDTWHHIDARLRYLDRLRPALAPGGRVAIVDFKPGDIPVGPPPEHRLSRETIEGEFAEAGWRRVEFDETTLPYQFILVFSPADAAR